MMQLSFAVPTVATACAAIASYHKRLVEVAGWSIMVSATYGFTKTAAGKWLNDHVQDPLGARKTAMATIQGDDALKGHDASKVLLSIMPNEWVVAPTCHRDLASAA